MQFWKRTRTGSRELAEDCTPVDTKAVLTHTPLMQFWKRYPAPHRPDSLDHIKEAPVKSVE